MMVTQYPWLHVRDGSGGEGTNDLTVTTSGTINFSSAAFTGSGTYTYNTAALLATSIEGIRLYCWKMKPMLLSRNLTRSVSDSL